MKKIIDYPGHHLFLWFELLSKSDELRQLGNRDRSGFCKGLEKEAGYHLATAFQCQGTEAFLLLPSSSFYSPASFFFFLIHLHVVAQSVNFYTRFCGFRFQLTTY